MATSNPQPGTSGTSPGATANLLGTILGAANNQQTLNSILQAAVVKDPTMLNLVNAYGSISPQLQTSLKGMLNASMLDPTGNPNTSPVWRKLYMENPAMASIFMSMFIPQAQQMQLLNQQTALSSFHTQAMSDKVQDLAEHLKVLGINIENLTKEQIMAYFPTDPGEKEELLQWLASGMMAITAENVTKHEKWLLDTYASLEEEMYKMLGKKRYIKDIMTFHPDGTISQTFGDKIFSLREIGEVANHNTLVIKFENLRIFDKIWSGTSINLPDTLNIAPIKVKEVRAKDGTILSPAGRWVVKWKLAYMIYNTPIMPPCSQLDICFVISGEPIYLVSYDSLISRARQATVTPKYDKGEMDPKLDPMKMARLKDGRRSRLKFQPRVEKGYIANPTDSDSYFFQNSFDALYRGPNQPTESLLFSTCRTSDHNLLQPYNDLTGRPIGFPNGQIYCGVAMDCETTVRPTDALMIEMPAGFALEPCMMFEKDPTDFGKMMNKLLQTDYKGEEIPSNVEFGPAAPPDEDYIIDQPMELISVPEPTAVSVTPAAPQLPVVRALDKSNRFAKLAEVLDICTSNIGHCLDKYSLNRFQTDLQQTFTNYMPYMTPADHPWVGYDLEDKLENAVKNHDHHLKFGSLVHGFAGIIWKPLYEKKFVEAPWSMARKVCWVFGTDPKKDIITDYKSVATRDNKQQKEKPWDPTNDLPFSKFWSGIGGGNWRELINDLTEFQIWMIQVYQRQQADADSKVTDQSDEKKRNVSADCVLGVFTCLGASVGADVNGVQFSARNLLDMNRTNIWDPYDWHDNPKANSDALRFNTAQRRARLFAVWLEVVITRELISFLGKHTDVISNLSIDEKQALKGFAISQTMPTLNTAMNLPSCKDKNKKGTTPVNDSEKMTLKEMLMSFAKPWPADVWPAIGTNCCYRNPEDSSSDGDSAQFSLNLNVLDKPNPKPVDYSFYRILVYPPARDLLDDPWMIQRHFFGNNYDCLQFLWKCSFPPLTDGDIWVGGGNNRALLWENRDAKPKTPTYDYLYTYTSQGEKMKRKRFYDQMVGMVYRMNYDHMMGLPMADTEEREGFPGTIAKQHGVTEITNLRDYCGLVGGDPDLTTKLVTTEALVYLGGKGGIADDCFMNMDLPVAMNNTLDTPMSDNNKTGPGSEFIDYGMWLRNDKTSSPLEFMAGVGCCPSVICYMPLNTGGVNAFEERTPDCAPRDDDWMGEVVG